MGVAISVGSRSYPIGTPSFLNAFFSTIGARLESERWGTRFPVLMQGLYSGRLASHDAEMAQEELATAQRELAEFGPHQVVWDFHNRAARPPWGDNVSPRITSLANYFVTSDGKDLFEVLHEALTESHQSGQPAIIR